MKMLKNIKKVLIAAIFVAASLSGTTLEDADRYIAEEKNPAEKQNFICEREALFILKDPTLCIKAAQISLQEYQSKRIKFRSYEEYRAIMYSNAGFIYAKIGDDTNKIKMYKKALEISPNNDLANLNFGVAYYFGKGVETNKIKAYEHLRVAAKQGNEQAQKNLDILCKESPWACK